MHRPRDNARERPGAPAATAALSRVPRAGLLYRLCAWVAFAVMRVQRWRIDDAGLAQVPRRGGAVIVANHTSFVDFFVVGRAPYHAYGRPVRILAKESLFRAPILGLLMRRAEHIEVHRGAGRDALASAVEALRAGELILVLPEQTISRSFELMEFKTGAVRMAAAAGVPLIPAVSWGSHRFHTAGRRPRWSWRLPVVVRFGRPHHPRPDADPDAAMAALRDDMAAMLDEAIRAYPDPPARGDWWMPARLGGSAPTREEAERYDADLTASWRAAAARLRARGSGLGARLGSRPGDGRDRRGGGAAGGG